MEPDIETGHHKRSKKSKHRHDDKESLDELSLAVENDLLSEPTSREKKHKKHDKGKEMTDFNLCDDNLSSCVSLEVGVDDKSFLKPKKRRHKSNDHETSLIDSPLNSPLDNHIKRKKLYKNDGLGFSFSMMNHLETEVLEKDSSAFLNDEKILRKKQKHKRTKSAESDPIGNELYPDNDSFFSLNDEKVLKKKKDKQDKITEDYPIDNEILPERVSFESLKDIKMRKKYNRDKVVESDPLDVLSEKDTIISLNDEKDVKKKKHKRDKVTDSNPIDSEVLSDKDSFVSLNDERGVKKKKHKQDKITEDFSTGSETLPERDLSVSLSDENIVKKKKHKHEKITVDLPIENETIPERDFSVSLSDEYVVKKKKKHKHDKVDSEVLSEGDFLVSLNDEKTFKKKKKHKRDKSKETDPIDTKVSPEINSLASLNGDETFKRRKKHKQDENNESDLIDTDVLSGGDSLMYFNEDKQVKKKKKSRHEENPDDTSEIDKADEEPVNNSISQENEVIIKEKWDKNATDISFQIEPTSDSILHKNEVFRKMEKISKKNVDEFENNSFQKSAHHKKKKKHTKNVGQSLSESAIWKQLEECVGNESFNVKEKQTDKDVDAENTGSDLSSSYIPEESTQQSILDQPAKFNIHQKKKKSKKSKHTGKKISSVDENALSNSKCIKNKSVHERKQHGSKKETHRHKHKKKNSKDEDLSEMISVIDSENDAFGSEEGFDSLLSSKDSSCISIDKSDNTELENLISGTVSSQKLHKMSKKKYKEIVHPEDFVQVKLEEPGYDLDMSAGSNLLETSREHDNSLADNSNVTEKGTKRKKSAKKTSNKSSDCSKIMPINKTVVYDEMAGSMDSEEARAILDKLDITELPVDFEIPALHERVQLKSFTKEEKADFIARGISIRDGRYTKKERETLLENWNRIRPHLEIKDPALLLGCNLNGVKPKKLLKYVKAKNLYVHLARGLDSRSLYSVYKQARTLFYPGRNHEKLNKQEVKELKDHQAKFGKNWTVISELLQKTPSKCAIASTSHQDGQNSGTWSKEEEERLKEAVHSEAGEDVEKLAKGSASAKWSAISKLVKTRNLYQCRSHWLEVLSATTTIPVRSRWTKTASACLIFLLYRNRVEDSADVDWSSIFEHFKRYVYSTMALMKKWAKMKGKYPGLKGKPHGEIVTYMFQKALPGLMREQKLTMGKLMDITSAM